MSTHSLDSVAEWFLRLNGFLTVLNFVVHPVEPQEGSQQRTDADVIGIRFPHRQEVVGGRALRDHAAFQGLSEATFVIAEVKTGRCRLNGPWSTPHNQNVDHVLRALGAVEPDSVEVVSAALYERGHFNSPALQARLLCFGSERSSNLPTGTLQFTWNEVFSFVYDRYQVFWRVKRQNQQWPPVGRLLWDRCRDRSRVEFVREMLGICDLPPA